MTNTLYVWYLGRYFTVKLLDRVPRMVDDVEAVVSEIGPYMRELAGAHPSYVRLAIQMMFSLPQDGPDIEPSVFTSLTELILGALLHEQPGSELEEAKPSLEEFLVKIGVPLQ